jgi:phosphatidylinositol alpha-mannosyltransferase
MQGTFIGVLMSATLPGPARRASRALIVARRLGRARETLPVVLGTLVSQTLLNIVALVALGSVMFATIGLFAGPRGRARRFAVAPVAVLLAVLPRPRCCAPASRHASAASRRGCARRARR